MKPTLYNSFVVVSRSRTPVSIIKLDVLEINLVLMVMLQFRLIQLQEAAEHSLLARVRLEARPNA